MTTKVVFRIAWRLEFSFCFVVVFLVERWALFRFSRFRGMACVFQLLRCYSRRNDSMYEFERHVNCTNRFLKSWTFRLVILCDACNISSVLVCRNKDQKKKQHICHFAGCNKVYGKTSHLRAHIRYGRRLHGNACSDACAMATNQTDTTRDPRTFRESSGV